MCFYLRDTQFTGFFREREDSEICCLHFFWGGKRNFFRTHRSHFQNYISGQKHLSAMVSAPTNKGEWIGYWRFRNYIAYIGNFFGARENYGFQFASFRECLVWPYSFHLNNNRLFIIIIRNGFPILQVVAIISYILNLIYFDGKLLMTNITYFWCKHGNYIEIWVRIFVMFYIGEEWLFGNFLIGRWRWLRIDY